MNTQRLVGAFWLCAAVLHGCASTTSEPERAEPADVVIEGMVIRNELLFPVTDVMVNVPATGAFVGCGNILQGSECRTSFEAVDYSGNALVVSWKEYGTQHQTDEFVVDVPRNLDAGRPAWLEVVIFAMGQAGSRFIQ
jgi:hypothetical protein